MNAVKEVGLHDILPAEREPAPMATVQPSAPRTTLVREPVAEPQPLKASEFAYRHSETFGRLAMALAQAQGQFETVEKTLTATVTSKREGVKSYNYQYADLSAVLSAVRPGLAAHGLAIMQMPTVRSKTLLVTTMLVHGESNEWFAGDLIVALESIDAQIVGGAMTYARRYGLLALLGIAAGERDTDASPRQPARPTQRATPAPAGYDQWLLDMEAVSENGLPALTKAWNESQQILRRHMNATDPGKWQALRERAGRHA